MAGRDNKKTDILKYKHETTSNYSAVFKFDFICKLKYYLCVKGLWFFKLTKSLIFQMALAPIACKW